MADYLGTNERMHDYFVKDWTRPGLTHAECAGMWLKILSTIFCFPNDHPFQIKPQFQPYQSLRQYSTATKSRSNSSTKPVWVLSDDEGTIVVVELRSSTEFTNWGSVRGQAYDYIYKLNKNTRPTIGIIAQGDKFICWEQIPVGGEGRFECTLPRRLFPVRGMPASVVSDSLAVQGYFEDVKERVMIGDFGKF